MNEQLYKLLISACIILFVFFIRWGIFRFLLKNITNIKTRYNWQKAVTYVSYFLIIIAITVLWLKEFQSAATFLGLLTAGLAIALREPILNLFAWLFVILNRPFEVGDRITISGISGDVIDISFFKFSLLEIGAWVNANQSTGRIVHIPNGKVFGEPITNFSQGFEYIWNEISIQLTLNSNWKQAKKILLDIELEREKMQAEEQKASIVASEMRYNIEYKKLTPTVYTRIKDKHIELTLRYLCDPRNQRNSEQIIWESLLVAFEDWEDIRLS